MIILEHFIDVVKRSKNKFFRHKYICFYVLTWLFFSLVYYSTLRSSFIYSNPVYDPAFNDFKEEIIQGLCGAYGKYNSKVFQTKCVVSFHKHPFVLNEECIGSSCGTNDLSGIHIELGRVTSTGIEVRFFNFVHFFSSKLKGMGTTGSNGDLFELRFSEFREGMDRYTLHLLNAGGIYELNMSSAAKQKYKSLTHYILDLNLLPKEELNFSPNSEWFQFVIKRQIPPFVWHLRSYIDGTPAIEPSFLKMLYFSGVTILTIGYGDIAPLSWVARILALLEGFIGVFLIGLFVADEFERYKEARKLKSAIWLFTKSKIKDLLDEIENVETQLLSLDFSKLNNAEDEKRGVEITRDSNRSKRVLLLTLERLNEIFLELIQISRDAPSDIEISENLFKSLLILDELSFYFNNLDYREAANNKIFLSSDLVRKALKVVDRVATLLDEVANDSSASGK